jgi:hypothetical protein
MPTVKALGLYDLLAPQYLLGLRGALDKLKLPFAEHIDKYLSMLAVRDLQTTSDPNAVLYTGTVYFTSTPGQPPVLSHQDPSGAIFDFNDITFKFRLLIPRAGASLIPTGISSFGSFVPGLQPLTDNAFGAQTASPTDYPGFAFQLDLLLNLVTLHLGKHWKPAKMNPDFTVSVDPAAKTKDVLIQLPKILFRYSQTPNLSQDPLFEVVSWGDPGFDAPHDLAEGQLATMAPPLAIHESGRVAFGIDTLILDLSENGTPPEVLQQFGVGTGFTGLYAKAIQVFYCDAQKDFALNFAVRDMLISFAGETWLTAELDLIFAGLFNVTITTYDPDPDPQFKTDPNQGTYLTSAGSWTGGSITMSPASLLFLRVAGGLPPYSYTVSTGAPVGLVWSDTDRQAAFTSAPPDSQSVPLTITVTDSSTPQQVYKNLLNLNVVLNGSSPAIPAATSPAQATCSLLNSSSLPAGYDIQFNPSTSGVSETLVVQGGATVPTISVDNSQPWPIPDRKVVVKVDPGKTVSILVTYPAITTGIFNLAFDHDKPDNDAVESTYYDPLGPPDDQDFSNNTVPAGTSGGDGLKGAAALTWWIANALDLSQLLTIVAWATDEGQAAKNPFAKDLAKRRGDIAKQIIAGVAGATAQPPTYQIDHQVSGSRNNAVVITGTPKPSTGYTLSGSLTRPANLVPPVVAPPTPPPSPPCPPANPKPKSLRRLSIKVRFEESHLVMGEISGEIDFKTQIKGTLANQAGLDPNDSSNNLAYTSSAAATAAKNPGDGIVDFSLNVTYDLETHDLTETLSLGAAPADKDGLVHVDNSSNRTLLNMLGSVLTFTPILNAATKALDPKGAGEWAAIGIDLGLPLLMVRKGGFTTGRATLYGGTLKLRENIPGDSDPTTFTNAALTFDYGVTFDLDISLFGSKLIQTKDASVRYRAVGVNLNFGKTPVCQFVLDTSKGYSLDLGNPSMSTLQGALGNILKIAAARIARFNPVTLELDLEIKADLGIITVDKFIVKIPLDTNDSPSILPSGIRVNIPATITGQGSVKIGSDGGFDGNIDLTLCALKLRVVASVGVHHLSQLTPPREVTAFFLGLEIDFPAPIMIGATGIRLFGLFGLFGMHYDRVLPNPVAGDVVGPDLRWLISTGGQPYLLAAPSSAPKPGNPLWAPKIDNWAFGVGAILGTTDGYLLSLRGMVLFELPGPRLIFTVNLKFIEELDPPTPDGMDATELDVGVVGILDIDIGAGQITLGVIIDLEITDLISAQIPIQVFFNWNDPKTWHFWMGTIQTPISAKILGIIRGGGYFMMGGQAIQPFPPGSSGSLPGVAVAMGVFAGIIWGNQSSIYLKVAAAADFGVSFSPHLFIAGRIHVEGELGLVVISIGVSGDFDVTAPNPVYLHVHICGHVKFFFFSISACVDFEIGATSDPGPPPALVAKLYVQSFAPVIAQGQGDRPIDASLGDGVVLPTTGQLPAQPAMVTVPIDSVPVIQLLYGVAVSVAGIPVCPTYPGSPGVNLGGGRFAQYTLSSLTITAVPPDPNLPALTSLPMAWRPNNPSSNSSQTQVDLALFTRNPNVTSGALERSTELTNGLASTWGDSCDPIAPAACVFWAFCGQSLGPSPNGWTLFGTPTPDPPNTIRLTPVPTEMQVEQPVLSAADALLQAMAIPLTGTGLYPAQVIGNPASPAAVGSGLVGNVGAAAESAASASLPAVAKVTATPPGAASGVATTAPGMVVSPTLLDFIQSPPSLVIAPQTVTLSGAASGTSIVVSASTASGGNWLIVPTATVKSTGSAINYSVSVNLTGLAAGIYKGTVTFSIPGAASVTVQVTLVVRGNSGFATPSQLSFSGLAPSPVIAPQTVAIAAVYPTLNVAVTVATSNGGNWLSASPLAFVAPASVSVSVNAAGLAPGVYAGTVTFVFANGGPTQVVQVALTITAANDSCMRAIELPELLAVALKVDLTSGFTTTPPSEAAAAAVKNATALANGNRWLRFHTGASNRVRILLAVDADLYQHILSAPAAAASVVIRERDDSGALLLETQLPAFKPVVVTSLAALPATWTSTTGPWYEDVVSILALLAPQSGKMTSLFVEFVPKPAATVIEVAVTRSPTARPSVVVGALESCPMSEAVRATNGQQVQAAKVQALQGYLDGGTSVPLLAPGTVYTITVGYDAVVGSTPYGGNTQSYEFQTDAQPPARLDPWVLCASPDQTGRFAFYEDPVAVIFNDQSIFDLFAKYGYQLVMDLHAADGLPETFDPAVKANTAPLPGVGPATYDSLRDLVLNGVDGKGKLPCVGATVPPYQNAKFSPPSVHLRPLMGYTLDLNTSPATPLPTDGSPVNPPFRIGFSTGKYASLHTLAKDLGGTRITHRALQGPLGFATTGGQHVTMDLDIQQAFMSAGEQALPAPEKNAIVMYWAPSGNGYVPHAILIDSIEPLWRQRPEPSFTKPIATDPTFRIVTIGQMPSLEIVDPTGSIGAFIVSPGGARTVAMFKAGFAPPAAGTVVTLVLHRPDSTVYGSGDQEAIVNLPVTPHAPWEDDHV